MCVCGVFVICNLHVFFASVNKYKRLHKSKILWRFLLLKRWSCENLRRKFERKSNNFHVFKIKFFFRLFIIHHNQHKNQKSDHKILKFALKIFIIIFHVFFQWNRTLPSKTASFTFATLIKAFVWLIKRSWKDREKSEADRDRATWKTVRREKCWTKIFPSQFRADLWKVRNQRKKFKS